MKIYQWFKKVWFCAAQNISLFEDWLEHAWFGRAIKKAIEALKSFGVRVEEFWERHKFLARVLPLSIIFIVISIWILAITGVMPFGLSDFASQWNYFLAGLFINNDILKWFFDGLLKLFQGGGNTLAYCFSLLLAVIIVAWFLKQRRPHK